MTDYLDTLLNSMSTKFNETEVVDLNLNEDKTLKWRGLLNNKSATFGRHRDRTANNKKEVAGDGEVSSTSSSSPSTSTNAAPGHEKLLGGAELTPSNACNLNSDADIKLLPKTEEFPSDNTTVLSVAPTHTEQQQQQEMQQQLPSSPVLQQLQTPSIQLQQASPSHSSSGTVTSADNKSDATNNTQCTPNKDKDISTATTFDKPKRVLRRKPQIEPFNNVIAETRNTKRNKSKESKTNVEDEQKVLELPASATKTEAVKEAILDTVKMPVGKSEDEPIQVQQPKRRGRAKKQPPINTETSQSVERGKSEEKQQIVSKGEDSKSLQLSKSTEKSEDNKIEPKSLRLRRSERTQTINEQIHSTTDESKNSDQFQKPDENKDAIVLPMAEEKPLINVDSESVQKVKPVADMGIESPKRKRKAIADVDGKPSLKEVEKENLKTDKIDSETINELNETVIPSDLDRIKTENASLENDVTGTEQKLQISIPEIKVPKKRGRKPGKKLVDTGNTTTIKKSPRISKDTNDLYNFVNSPFGKKDKTPEQVSYKT